METILKSKSRNIFYIVFSAAVMFVVSVFILTTLILFAKVDDTQKQTLLNQAEIHFNNERLDNMIRIDSTKMKVLNENNKLLKDLIENGKSNPKEQNTK